METSVRAGIRAGDQNAFRELFDGHVRAVYNHAFRLTGDWSAAEDVVSLTFLEAWRLRGQVDAGGERGSLRAWLLGIATNVARNTRRAARRYGAALTRLPKAEAVPDHGDEIADRAGDRERLDLALRAMAALRRPEREVLALCVWSGLGYTEAAAALGVKVGTVKSRLSRARAKLAKLTAAGPSSVPAADREPGTGRGQVQGDRGTAVRLAQENTR